MAVGSANGRLVPVCGGAGDGALRLRMMLPKA
jgi:hypothetical protein